MDVKGIVANYETALKKQEEKAQSEIEKKKQQRLFNGEAVEKCIKTIIEPLFEKTRAEFNQLKYSCDVDLIFRKDTYTNTEQLIALGIKLSAKTIKGKKSFNDSYLIYEGSFDCQELTKKCYLSEDGPAIKSEPISMNRLTAEMVEEDIEDFLKQVFSFR